MKNKKFISELVENEVVQTVFLASKKAIREARTGNPYLCVTLSDKSGSVDARAWDNATVLAERFKDDDFVAVRGRVSSYRDVLQINIDDLTVINEDDVDVSAFLPISQWSAEALFDQLLELLHDDITNPEIRRFLLALLDDPDRVKRFKKAPAAMANHHNYLGGLLEHSLSMARVGIRLCDHYDAYYPGLVDRNFIIAGCILHDIGKCEELNYSRSINYSTQGKLVGHIVHGVEIINEVALNATPKFDEDLLMQLKHLVLSHHGKMEYGAPVLPRTPEALLLHEIDMIDSRMNMLAILYKDKMADDHQTWTDYKRLFDGSMYINKNFAHSDNLQIIANQLVGPGKLKDARTSQKQQNNDNNGAKAKSSKKSAIPAGAAESMESQTVADDGTLDLFGNQ